MMILVACLLMSSQTILGKPIDGAFSHNDYAQKRPLFDALEQGMIAVEADVFLVDGKLLVAHDRDKVSPEKTLSKLYLDPLVELAQQNQNRIYSSRREPFWLMIDIKANGEEVYKSLAKELAKHPRVFAKWTKDGPGAGAVGVVLSGDRPIDAVTKDSNRQVAIDGRPGDLATNPPVGLVPWISSSWLGQFKWLGFGEFPPDQRQSLVDLVSQVHAQKRKIRFWAMPDNKVSWALQREVGIDFINTDKPNDLRKWVESSR